jgi:cytochrome P450
MTSRTIQYAPKGNFLTGNVGEYRKDTLGYEKHLAQKYGDVVGLSFAGRKALLLNHPDDIHQVLVTQASKFNKSPVYQLILSRFLGNGLVTSDGDFWKRQRKMTQPAFHTKRIGAYGEIMVDFSKRMMDEWKTSSVRDINRDMMRLTLNVVSKTLFNAEMDKNAAQVNEALTMVLHAIDDTIKSPLFLPQWLPLPHNLRMKKATRTLDAIINHMIEERRKTNEDNGDLLSMLLLSEDENGERMTDTQVRDEAVTLFSAGHETTANALTWTWYLLSEHPKAEAKLHEELDRVLGGRMPTLEDLRRLPYTEMVIKESMRIYSPVPSIGRQAIEDVQLNDLTIPKDTIILIAPHIVHNDARWWDEPEAFRPERFENEKDINKYAYFPFGGGPRICIGNSFAMMEGVLVLAAMAQHYQLRHIPDAPVIPEPTLTLRPKHVMKMRVEARTPKVPVQADEHEMVEA